MTDHKIQRVSALEEEMRTVARSEKPAPAAVPSFGSVEALARLLTPENRRLLAMIRDGKPQSVAELSAWTGRAEPNLLRTLEKLRAAGLVRIEQAGRRRVPMAAVGKIVVEIDPPIPRTTGCMWNRHNEMASLFRSLFRIAHCHEAKAQARRH